MFTQDKSENNEARGKRYSAFAFSQFFLESQPADIITAICNLQLREAI